MFWQRMSDGEGVGGSKPVTGSYFPFKEYLMNSITVASYGLVILTESI